ncbi:sensor histidine kinase [Actinomarinicola tropica]|nr:nitrate- and nitrite sensing domain-containing protein [Actinomarinicola tropica]
MKVGTKLLAVVLPPLLVLVAVAGIGAKDRLDEAADARTAETYVELARSSAFAMDALQNERSLSVLAVVDPDAAEGLEQQRSATDATLADFADQVDDLGTTDPLRVIGDAAVARQADIATIRASVDRGSIDPLIVNTWYIDTIARQLDVATGVSNEVPFPEVSADLTALVSLARAWEGAAQVQSALTLALGQDEFDVAGRQWRVLVEATSNAEEYGELFFAMATPEQAAAVRRQLQSQDATRATEFRLSVIDAMAPYIQWLTSGEDNDGRANSIAAALDDLEPPVEALTPQEWITLSDQVVAAQAVVGLEMLDSVESTVSDARSDTEREALIFLLVAVASVIGSAALAFLVARRITRPLRSLTEAADRLSGEQLPALVERLKSPSSGGGEVILEPISMNRSDEIGHLADAFDSIQRVTVEVAEEQQSLLKKGIGDIFVNLARRNQTLLDRQIEFIDQLESQEEDPDVLEDLFKLDHLATRMRRNAESLLVLAGIETGHRRSRPVALADVVRVAIGEVEDFARLNLVAMDDAVVTGAAAMDVAHLLSELMENATSFSPPETSVEILGHQNADGTYVLSISDQGIGMSDEQFAETNKLLAEPPLVGLTLSRSLGFTVVGRLAARFSIDVRLTSSPTGGVTALVTLPTAILESSSISVEEAPAQPEPAATVAEPEPQPATPPSAAFAPAPVAEQATPEPAAEYVPDVPAPDSLATAVPEGAAFDAGLAALMGDDVDAPATEHDAPFAAPAPVDAAPSFDEPAPAAEPATASAPEPARTASGLVKRVPKSAGTATQEEPRPTAEAPIARTQRSPEEVRAMLSRYRSGLHRGREADSPNGEGSN